MKYKIVRILASAAAIAICGPACGGGSSNSSVSGPGSGEYVVLAWNDLGMHCLNPTYDTAVILPPYNTIWAQVVRRGDPPQPVTEGLTVEYSIDNNTYSYGKAEYGQFWDNCEALFGAALEHDTGLNLSDPAQHNGLAGTMVVAASGDHFEVHGIPVVPVDDDGTWNPFQVATITVKDSSGNVVAETKATVPTSEEIRCSNCHGVADPFGAILDTHDTLSGTDLAGAKPVLCASCHGSPALGLNDPGTSGKFLSEAIHGYHADKGATCYDCHPGPQTKCSRSLAHATDDGNCVACHGGMADVAASIADGSRTPWAEEPTCVQCHTGVAQVDTAAGLYRNAAGHGGLACPACHGSPHAMVPSREESDNYQGEQYQSASVTIGSCAACHASSRGAEEEPEEFGEEFAEKHGGASPERRTACNVCHTAVPTDTANWPHAFEWTAH
ncbi:MAG: cytochrome c3 family protein [Proteobacteria bacterium]|jgi:hypothetical protein|nr:cytochrome c3 family protein [Pseudomonadota bacterium]